MLLEFTVGNTLSFYANKTLSLQAQSLKDIEENVAHVSSYRILKSLALYGANSSGKSNLINSLAIMRHTVLSSVQLNPNDSLYFDPFLLFKNNNKPCFFEIVFLLDEQLYRYGFSYTEKKIIDECGITLSHFYVLTSNLRSKGILTETGINPKLIPRISKDNNGYCQLLLLFKDEVIK